MPSRGLKQLLQTHRKGLACGILAAGVGLGLLLYLIASPPPADLLSNESKQYLREMETYGGTANVLAAEFREWFDGLWQGPTLGITVACLSALLALVVYVALTPLANTGDAGD